MARLHAADPAAWTEMVRLHGSALHRYLTSLGAVHVDDLVQEVFLRALRAVRRGVDTPPHAAAVRPWLIVIARHLQRDSRRRDRLRVTLAIDGEIALPSTQPSALDAMQQMPLAVEWHEPMPAARVFTLDMPESGVVEREITPLVAGHVNVIVDEGAVVSIDDAAGQHWQQSALWRYVDEASPGALLDPGIRRFEAIASGPASVHVVHRDGSVTDRSIVVLAGQWATVVAAGR